MNLLQRYILIVFCSLSLFVFSQSKIDSLEKSLSTSPDSVKLKTYNMLVRLSVNNSPEKAMCYAQDMLALAKKIKNKFETGMALNVIGIVHRNMSNYDSALTYYTRSLEIRKEINDKKGIAASYNNIGLLMFHQADYAKAMENYLKALEILEGMKDSLNSPTHRKTIALALNNVALVYTEQENHEKALEYYTQFYKINEQLGDKNGMGVSLNNIGVCYEKRKDFDKAADYYQQSLSIREEINDRKGMADCMSNLANIYDVLGKKNASYEMNIKALKLHKEINNKDGQAVSFSNLGKNYNDRKEHKKAEESFLKALKISEEMGNRDMVMNICNGLSSTYTYMKDFEKALEYERKYSATRDSILNENNSRFQKEVETKYETAKKNSQIELLKREKEIEKLSQQTEVDKQKTMKNYFILGSVLLLLAAFFLYSRFNLKRKANALLEQKNKLIEEKNKDITDSIRYAKRIQEAIFPPDEMVKRLLPDSFVLFKPKDIVSGDFYWTAEWGNVILFATVDCTGHGVPGAFMSIVGNNLLNQAVNEYGLSKPNLVLNFLNKGVSNTLRQEVEKSKVKDGMDISLCSFESKTGILEFSGANNPLYLIRNNEFSIISADRQSIGTFVGEEIQKFTSTEINIQKDDMIYIFSDGYADQFGGAEGKKFKYRQLQQFLVSIHHEPVHRQKEKLDKKIEQWRGSIEQVDDILIMGVRF